MVGLVGEDIDDIIDPSCQTHARQSTRGCGDHRTSVVCSGGCLPVDPSARRRSRYQHINIHGTTIHDWRYIYKRTLKVLPERKRSNYIYIFISSSPLLSYPPLPLTSPSPTPTSFPTQFHFLTPQLKYSKANKRAANVSES